MKKSIVELEQLLWLLNIEREEELRQFELQVASLSLTEKRANGVSWFPLQILDHCN